MPSTKTPRRNTVEKAWHSRGVTGYMTRKSTSKSGTESRGWPKSATADAKTDGRNAYSGASSRTRMRNGEAGAYEAAQRLKKNSMKSKGYLSGPSKRPNNGKKK